MTLFLFAKVFFWIQHDSLRVVQWLKESKFDSQSAPMEFLIGWVF